VKITIKVHPHNIENFSSPELIFIFEGTSREVRGPYREILQPLLRPPLILKEEQSTRNLQGTTGK